jgi:hypothetical protein
MGITLCYTTDINAQTHAHTFLSALEFGSGIRSQSLPNAILYSRSPDTPQCHVFICFWLFYNRRVTSQRGYAYILYVLLAPECEYDTVPKIAIAGAALPFAEQSSLAPSKFLIDQAVTKIDVITRCRDRLYPILLCIHVCCPVH